MHLPKRSASRGMTLVEVTLVILVLLGLVNILFWGGMAFKHGVDRQTCLINIANCQKAVRSYQNLNDLRVGDPAPGSQLFGAGRFYEVPPQCPDATGVYQWLSVIPEAGQSYVRCSLALSREHAPYETHGW